MTGNSKTPAAIKAVVTGRVQGVYYRVFVQRQATKLQLSGYVQNRRDLSVEVYAEGDKANLEQLLALLKKGPPGARIDDLYITWTESANKYSVFIIVP